MQVLKYALATLRSQRWRSQIYVALTNCVSLEIFELTVTPSSQSGPERVFLKSFLAMNLATEEGAGALLFLLTAKESALVGSRFTTFLFLSRWLVDVK